MKYLVTFTKHYEYWIEADDDQEAVDKGYEEFCRERKIPVADTSYDEILVEPQESEDAD